jgi:hypothetical protein
MREVNAMSSLRCPRLLLVALLIPALAGCFYSRRARDVESDPTVDTGMGASIILPGQTAPPMSMGTPVPAGAEASGAGNTVQRPNLSMIGGSEIDKERHETGKEDPLIFKALMTPLAVLAAPFVAAADAMKGDPEPSPAVPDQKTPRPDVKREPAPEDYESQQAGATPPEGQASATARPPDFETQQIQQMERELARRQGAATPPATTRAPAPAIAQSSGSDGSIASELASLQRTPARPRTTGPPIPTPAESTLEAAALVGPEVPVADGIVDRNEDGRIDLWIYRQDGEIVRRALDQNYDGRPDVTMIYDPQTHRLARIEEDADQNGATDSWTDYREGEVSRRRVDSDQDGTVDTWTFYRDGEISRHELDTSGDGFRDRVGFYAGGRIAREEQDNDGDGRPDVTNHYDANQKVSRREEDTDHDGAVDLISHYENGRLARRELLGDATATP